MSKAAKSKARARRLQMKRSRKTANKAKYQSWAIAGENVKSSRFRKRSKKSNNTDKGKHLTMCGNIACLKCFTHNEFRIVARQTIKHI